jgi:hypothetical protein
MSNLIRIYVGEDLAGTLTIGENAKGFDGFIEAVSNNPEIIDVSDLDNLPVIGMYYLDGKFSSKKKDKLSFKSNTQNSSLKIFAFIVNSKVVCVQQLFSPHLDGIIAAFQSNPRFEIE